MLSFIKSPPTSKNFWFANIATWFVLAAINFINRNMQNVESTEQGLYSAFGIVFFGILCSLLLRELCHQLKLETKPFNSFWKYLIFLAIVLGLLCAFLNVAWAASYFIAAGYSSRWVIFWLSVQNNWLLMTILMFVWGFVYLGTLKFQKLLYMEKELSRLKDSQLNTLMGQLNPHFLFNGLNNIRSLMLEDVDKARNMLTNLADVIRYSLLSHRSAQTSIKEELEIVTLYIELAKIQYEERLNFVSEIDESLLQQKIPTLLIQLLVENAVRHGIDRSTKGGDLTLRIAKKAEKFLITVTNPGALTSDNRGKLTPDKNGTGIGLENINSRLNLLYAEQANFELVEKDGLVVAICTLPMTVMD